MHRRKREERRKIRLGTGWLREGKGTGSPAFPDLAQVTWSLLIHVTVLPEFTSVGDLPPGVHSATRQEFQSRFGQASARRVWLFGRLQALLELAVKTDQLHRVFVWGSFVTSKPAPRDIDVLLIMNEDFEVDRIAAPSRAVFDSVQAKLLFETDVFWARSTIGEAVLQLWLETYQVTRSLQKRGIVELELS